MNDMYYSNKLYFNIIIILNCSTGYPSKSTGTSLTVERHELFDKSIYKFYVRGSTFEFIHSNIK